MAELGDAAPAGEPRPFTFGAAPLRTGARLNGLERMGEKLARRIRAVIEPFARAKATVTAEPIETRRFEEWRADLPGFTSLSLYRLRPLKGGMLLALEPAFITAMVDSFYGGSGTPGRARTNEFTPTEERILSRLADTIVEVLGETWSEATPIQPQLTGRETNAAYAQLVRGDEAVVVQRFTVAPAGQRPGTVSIVYPLSTIRGVEPLLSTKAHDDGPGDAEWRARLAEALAGVRLPVRSVLARPELSVSQLLELKPGDVIPITLAPSVPLTVAGRKLAHGTIGEREGRAALMIEQLEG